MRVPIITDILEEIKFQHRRSVATLFSYFYMYIIGTEKFIYWLFAFSALQYIKQKLC